MKPTAALVLKLVARPGGACPTTFARADLYAYRSRISELRQLGYTIERVPCVRHQHRTCQTKAYVITAFYPIAYDSVAS